MITKVTFILIGINQSLQVEGREVHLYLEKQSLLEKSMGMQEKKLKNQHEQFKNNLIQPGVRQGNQEDKLLPS
jgi:hypothetical protein